MEKAILKKLMSYSHLRSAFFKDEFKKTVGQFVIPFSFILYFKRCVFPLIRDSCDYYCPHANKCDGHRFLDFVETVYEFQQVAILQKKCFHKDFCFINLNDSNKLDDWDFHSYNIKDLSQYTFLQRMSIIEYGFNQVDIDQF